MSSEELRREWWSFSGWWGSGDIPSSILGKLPLGSGILSVNETSIQETFSPGGGSDGHTTYSKGATSGTTSPRTDHGDIDADGYVYLSHRNVVYKIALGGSIVTFFDTNSVSENSGIWVESITVAPDGRVWLFTGDDIIISVASDGASYVAYNYYGWTSFSPGIPYNPYHGRFVGDLLYVAAFSGVWVADMTTDVDLSHPTYGQSIEFTRLYAFAWNLSENASYGNGGQPYGLAIKNDRIFVSGDLASGAMIEEVPTSGLPFGTVATEFHGPDGYTNEYLGLRVVDNYLYAASSIDQKIYYWEFYIPIPPYAGNPCGANATLPAGPAIRVTRMGDFRAVDCSELTTVADAELEYEDPAPLLDEMTVTYQDPPNFSGS